MRAGHAIAMFVVVVTLAALLWPSRGTLSARPTVRIAVWGMPFEDRLFRDRYAKRYQELHPELFIDYERYHDELLMKYNAWHTRGRGAEVMRLRVTDYHGMVGRGMLEPLSNWINDPEIGLSKAQKEAIPPQLLAALTIDAEVYALPQDNAQFGMFINREIFRRHNAEHPQDAIEIPGPDHDWTWSDLRAAAKKLTRRDASGRVTQRGLDFTVWSWPFLNFFKQAGGELWSPDALTCTIDSDAGVEALAFMRAMQRDDKSFDPNLAGYLSATGPDVLFAAGQTAIFFDGSWRIPNIEKVNPGLDFSVVHLPRGRVPAVVSGCVCWGISSKAANKREAWRMLSWLTDEPQAAEYWDTLRVAPPANLAVINSPAFRSARGIEKVFGPTDAVPTNVPDRYEVLPMSEAMFADRAQWLLYANTPHALTGRPPGFVPVNLYETEMEEEVTRMLNEYLRDGSTLSEREALARVTRNIHRLIDRDRKAKGLPPARRSEP